VPYTPALQMLAAPALGPSKMPVPPKSGNEFQAAVDRVTARPEAETQKPSTSSAPAGAATASRSPVDQERGSVPENVEQEVETTAEQTSAEGASEAEVSETADLAATLSPAAAPVVLTPLVALADLLALAQATAPTANEAALRAPVAGEAAVSLPASLEADVASSPEVLKALAQVQPTSVLPQTAKPGAPTGPVAAAVNASAAAVNASAAAVHASAVPEMVSGLGGQVAGLTSSNKGPGLADTPPTFMNWTQEPEAEGEALPPVMGAITPVEMLDEAVGLEISRQATTLMDDVIPVNETETVSAQPSVNSTPAERSLTEVVKTEASAPSQAPPRAEEVLPQILKHAEALKAQQQNSIKLQLYPEHLGKVEIKVMSHQGVLSAQLTADSVQVKGLLETQLVGLQRSLQEMGLKVDRVEVALSSSNAGGFEGSSASFADSSSQQQGQDARPSSRLAPQYGSWATDDVDTVPVVERTDETGLINAIA